MFWNRLRPNPDRVYAKARQRLAGIDTHQICQWGDVAGTEFVAALDTFRRKLDPDHAAELVRSSATLRAIADELTQRTKGM